MYAKECLEEFRLECELRRLSKKTIKGYYNNTLRFLTYLEKLDVVHEIESVKPIHIKRYMQYLISCRLTSSYANGIMKSLRAYFKYAVQEGYIEQNPAEKVSWQREGKVLIQTFTDSEVERLLNAFNFSNYLSARNRLILAIAFDTGARNSEICDIQTVDIRDNVILIHGKGNKERNVPITPYLRKTMMKYERLKEQYFADKCVKYGNYILSRTGRPMTTVALENIFKQANAVANIRPEIRCSPHTARHYYAQTNLRNGIDVYSLSRLLGHENINITKRYLQSLQDESIMEMALNTSPLHNVKV